MQIEDYLYEKKLHLPLLGKKLDNMKNEELNFLNRKIVGVIYSINFVKISCVQCCEGEDHSESDEGFICHV